MTAQEWLDAIAVSRRVLVTLSNVRETLTTWTQVGGTTAYSVTWLTQTHPGSFWSSYRALTGVNLNGTTLTLVANLAAVQATPSSYFYDTSTNLLYVATATGVDPDTLTDVAAVFALYFSSDTLTDTVLWEPRVTGALPALRDEESDLTLGLTTSMSGTLSLTNADRFFDDLAVRYLWHNATCAIAVGGGALPVANYYQAASLQVVGLPAAGDAMCVFQLRAFDNQIRNRVFPLHVYEDYFDPSAFSLMPSELHGQFMPMVWGTVYDVPITYLRASGLFDQYLVLDPLQAASGVVVSAVRATSRTTGGITTLDPAADYVAASYFVNIVRASYSADDYTFTVDASRVSTASVGTLASDLLSLVGVASASIDAAGFAQADAAWPAPMGLYVAGGSAPDVFQACGDLLRLVEQSSLARVTLGADGLWAIDVYDPSVPIDAPVMYEELLTRWQPVSGIQEPMALAMRVLYAQHVQSGQWTSTSASQTADGYRYQSVETITHQTLLVNDADAVLLASRLARINAAPTTRVEIDGPPALFTLASRNKVRVIRNRFPNSTGTAAYPGEGMEIEAIAKRPSDCRASATLGNMRGLGTRFKRVAPNGTANWASASPLEQATYVYCDRQGAIW